MSMHSTQAWHNTAQQNLSHAAHHQNVATKQCDASRRAHEVTLNENLNMYNELHGALEHKVSTSHRLIEKLEKRAGSLETSIGHTKQSMVALEASFRAKDPLLQLCLWRLEQREKRPLREQVRDHVEVALEAEKQTLVDAQRKLAQNMKKTKHMINGLEGKLAEVNFDLEQKQQALAVDEMCLRTTHRSWQTSVERAPASRLSSGTGKLPPVARSRNMSNQVAVHESTKNEVVRQQEATRLNQSGASREEVAMELRDETDRLIGRCNREADEAANQTESALQERINENQKMRRRLASEFEEISAKIDHTKATIDNTKNQIKSLEEPMENAATCASWRKQRATKEHIHDPVSTKLSEHQTSLLRAYNELVSHLQEEQAALQNLQQRRERLKEDLRDKTNSLHLDMNCLTHEAMTTNGRAGKSLSKTKLHRTLKVDPGFVPMPSIGYPSFSSGGGFSHSSGAMTAR